ncbi:unnamed protein product [Closterium sp. NIES-54]
MDAIIAHYYTPSSTTLGCHVMPFLFPDLHAFPTVAELITHLRPLNAKFVLPTLLTPPMYLTLHLLVTRLPNHLVTCLPHRLAPARDAILAMHPMDLTIDLFENTLTKIETSLRTIASTNGALIPPIFEGCAPPQVPNFTASTAIAEPITIAEVTAITTPSGGRERRRGGHSRGGGGSACTSGSAETGTIGPGMLLQETVEACLEGVVARYSTPSSGTLGRLFMPFFFPDLPAFSTFTHLITHMLSLDVGSAGSGGAAARGVANGVAMVTQQKQH